MSHRSSEPDPFSLPSPDPVPQASNVSNDAGTTPDAPRGSSEESSVVRPVHSIQASHADLDGQVALDAAAVAEESQADADANQTRNFLLIALYQVVVRTGWIFKTESIIIPAVMDLIGGTPAMRGCLPLFNRFGQSIPPLLLARRVKITPRKKFGLVVSTTMMGLCFGTLALLWWVTGGQTSAWLPYAFLGIYALFFISTGVNHLFLNTLQGKLIAPTARGRQMLAANLTGSAAAISFAIVLLPRWVNEQGGRFDLVFGFCGVCFLLSTFTLIGVREPADNYQDKPMGIRTLMRQTMDALRRDRSLRRATYASMAFSSTMTLFPHYQALARDTLEMDFSYLMTWVVVQNVGTALFSLLTGLVADRFGNRAALRTSILLGAGAPALSMLLAIIGPTAGGWFAVVFLLVGLTPVTIKLFTNYTLELTVPSEHARYVSTVGLCSSLPILIGSPLLGWLIGRIGYYWVFSGVLIVLLLGWLLTFRIVEPRHKTGGDALSDDEFI